jgi:NADPH:quinone reductase
MEEELIVQAWQVVQHGDPTTALKLVEIDPPTPGPGEVRLRVHATALGMPDAFMCKATYALTPALPFVAGQEMCGTVIDAGEGASYAPGTRLMGVTSFTDGRGGFADETVAPEHSLYEVPDAMSDVDAAGFRIGYSTAWIGLVRRGQLRSGEVLLVLGAAGGSGATAIQLGRALGARVIAVAGGAEKVAYCERLGADVVIDRTQVDAVSSAVREATDDRGADVIYDPVGGDPAADAMRCIAKDGRFLLVGFASGRWADFDAPQVVRRNYSVVGVYAGGYSRDENLHDHAQLLALHEKGLLAEPVVTRTAPFEDLPAALEEVARGRAIGKTVLLPRSR